MSLSTDVTFTALAAALNDAVAQRYHVELTLLQYPSQGDFAWCYQNANQVFNEWTLDYLSAAVSPGDAPGLARLSGPGGLTQLGIRVVGSLTYALSRRDKRQADPAVLAMQQRQLALVTRMQAAGAAPDATTGGMLTVDPVTGTVTTRLQPAYSVNTPLATIQSALAGGGDTVRATVPGQGGAQVTFTWSNCVMVGVGPVAWQDSTGTGWWVEEPVTEAFANFGKDVSGFSFITAPPCTPGPVGTGGTAGRITGLLLGRPPVLTVAATSAPTLASAPTPAPAPALASAPTSAPAPLSPPAQEVLAAYELLGLGAAGAVPYRELPPPLSNGPMDLGPPSTTMTLAPAAGPVVPQLQQTAFVVGAVVEHW